MGQGCSQKPEEESGKTWDITRAQGMACLENCLWERVPCSWLLVANQGRVSAGGEGEMLPEGTRRDPKRGSGSTPVLLTLLTPVTPLTSA